jgi:ASC-1-like (ASCH) protein
MAKYVLRIREVDKTFFEVLKSGEKTIETRAATNKYRKIKKGDILKFTCGNEFLEKKVDKVTLFKNIDSLIERLDLKKIMPQVSSVKEAKEIWRSFHNYEEEIKKYGITAFELK